jgi:hypothetical protein
MRLECVVLTLKRAGRWPLIMSPRRNKAAPGSMPLKPELLRQTGDCIRPTGQTLPLRLGESTPRNARARLNTGQLFIFQGNPDYRVGVRHL